MHEEPRLPTYMKSEKVDAFRFRCTRCRTVGPARDARRQVVEDGLAHLQEQHRDDWDAAVAEGNVIRR